MFTIGIDIGGTQTRVALFDNDKIINTDIFSTSKDFNEGMDNIVKSISSYDEAIVGIGLCAPGAADFKTGTILESGALPKWENKSIIASLRNKTGISNIKMQNDANLAALGEYVAGEFKGSKIIQFFTVSTGLGAGLVIDGKIFAGFNGNATEINNFVVSDDEVGYGILVDGSIEASCSGTGIMNQAKKIGLATSTERVFELYKKNNSDAIFLIDRAIKRLGTLIGNTIGMIDPEAIVFSGSVALHNKWFIKKAFDYSQTLLMKPLRNKTKCEISKLEGLGALYGASHLVK